MRAPSFFWLDYETFGDKPRRDRPAQFAGIRTDRDLNIIGNPVMLYCQPTPDYLPSPQACLLTGITPTYCQQHGVPEYQFAQAIEQHLAFPGTVGVGYNSIRFDDEVTRFLFWRNLIDPYSHEWQNGCGRWDILDMVRTCYALRPEGIVWPQHENGQPSFKLEDLTRANGLLHEAAHDALSDVYATLALAKLIKTKQPKLFDFCFSLFAKAQVKHQIQLSQPQPILHISGMYNTQSGCMAIVWPLACHPFNQNEVIVWDLNEDPRQLLTLDAESIRYRLFTPTAELPTDLSRLPIKTIHINHSPIVIRQLNVLTKSNLKHWNIDLAKIQKHADYARALPQMTKIWENVYVPHESTHQDIDESLYGGFIGRQDRRVLDQLHTLPPEQLMKTQLSFDDTRLSELVFRYRARNFPSTLSPLEQQHWLDWCQSKLMTNDTPHTRNSEQFYQELIALEDSILSEKEKQIIQTLKDYAQTLIQKLTTRPLIPTK